MERYYIGQSACTAKTISETDVYLFAGITGDMNPMHINARYAQDGRFGGRIAHGMLSAGLISAVLGMQLPGPGSIYLRQELKFLAPVFPGDTVTARVTITDIDWARNQAVLATECINQVGATVVTGKATMLLPTQVE